MDISRVFNDGAERLCRSSLVFGVLRNPVATALLVTAVALVIIFAMYRDALAGTGRHRGIKTVFWVTIAVSAIIFTHYYALECFLRKKQATDGMRTLVNSVYQSAGSGRGFSVTPRQFGGGNDDDSDDDSDGDSDDEEQLRPRGAATLSPRRAPIGDDDDIEDIELVTMKKPSSGKGV